MGVALYFLVWDIWAKNGQFMATLKYLIPFSKSRACWMENHEECKNFNIK